MCVSVCGVVTVGTVVMLCEEPVHCRMCVGVGVGVGVCGGVVTVGTVVMLCEDPVHCRVCVCVLGCDCGDSCDAL